VKSLLAAARMPHITVDLIRRKAEHNEGLIHTLEEISLHQEELEAIAPVLGSNCRRIKILYLQVRRSLGITSLRSH
jgi:protein TilB